MPVLATRTNVAALVLAAAAGACAAPGGADRWFEVIAQRPGPEVTDVDMRRALEASDHPWKVRDRATGIEMVLVLPGEFLMGSPESEAGRKPDEGPQHRVRLTRPFYLGVSCVTQRQWRRLMGPTKSFFTGDELPIDPSCTDVRRFLVEAGAASPSTASALRLPSEAEWEYACRAGTTGPFAFDGPILQSLVNFNDGDVARAVVVDGVLEVEWLEPPSAACRMRPVAAGSLPPNAWGLHAMQGNLWEWTADRYDPDSYSGRGEVTVDPLSAATGDEPHTLRGGSWYDKPRFCRAAARDAGGPHTRSNRIGFRVARSLAADGTLR